jgi:hypothetical protein
VAWGIAGKIFIDYRLDNDRERSAYALDPSSFALTRPERIQLRNKLSWAHSRNFYSATDYYGVVIETLHPTKIDYLLRSNRPDQSIASEFFTADQLGSKFFSVPWNDLCNLATSYACADVDGREDIASLIVLCARIMA